MTLKGILFDKDGTLIDFYSLWLKAAQEVMAEFIIQNQLMEEDGLCEYLLATIGVNGDQVDPKGALAYKSYLEIAKDIKEALERKAILLETEQIHTQLVTLFDQSASQCDGKIRELTDTKQLVERLKKQGMKVGLATADTSYAAKQCLIALGVYDAFDYVGGDDGILKPKPEKDMFEQFTSMYHLKPEEVAVVGDTPNDMLFAKRCGGIGIGVLSGVSTKEDFGEGADYIIQSVNELETLIRK